MQSHVASARSVAFHYKQFLALPPEPVRVRPEVFDSNEDLNTESQRLLGPFIDQRRELSRQIEQERTAFYKYIDVEAVYNKYQNRVKFAQKSLVVVRRMLGFQTKRLQRRQRALRYAATRDTLTVQQSAELQDVTRQLSRIMSFAPSKMLRNKRLLHNSKMKLDKHTAQRKAAIAVYEPILKNAEAFETTCEKQDAGIAKTVLADVSLPALLHKTSGASFNRYGGANLSSLGRLAELCTTETRVRRQAPFDTYRTRLWNKLTLRRFKRERIARY